MGWLKLEAKNEKEKSDRQLDEDSKCPECVNSKITVNITENVYRQIYSVCRKYKELEWAAGLLGETDEKTGEITVTDMVFFEQKVTGAHVEFTDKGTIEMAKRTDLIGWIHSHNTMAVFFSSTDIDTANWNQLSVVVNNDMDIIAKCKKQFTCGRFGLVDCDVIIEYDEVSVDKIKELDKLIIEDTVTTTKCKYPGETVITNNGKTIYFCHYCMKSIQGKPKKLDGFYFHKKCKKKYLEEENWYYDNNKDVKRDSAWLYDEELHNIKHNKGPLEELEEIKSYRFGNI